VLHEEVFVAELASSMQFVDSQEEAGARPVPEPEEAEHSEVAGASLKRQSCMVHDEHGRVRKRERLASIFVGAIPVWSGDRLLYHFMVKQKTHGSYSNENEAALARDYAVRRIASLTGSKFREVNLDQFFLEDPLEKATIDKWVDETFVHAKQDAIHGVTERRKAGGALEYRVRHRINDRLIDFGVFDDAVFAGLYVSNREQITTKNAGLCPIRRVTLRDRTGAHRLFSLWRENADIPTVLEATVASTVLVFTNVTYNPDQGYSTTKNTCIFNFIFRPV
jgi:hypothetical protein